MFGFGMMTPEMLQRWSERQKEQRRRAEVYQATGMWPAEAYMRATLDMEHEEWKAIEEAKLADIRENGT